MSFSGSARAAYRASAQHNENGAIIAPIVPAFYTRPKTLDDMIDHSVGRLLDLFGIDLGTVHRWKEPASESPSGVSAKRSRE